jgi:hypothetical protein
MDRDLNLGVVRLAPGACISISVSVVLCVCLLRLDVGSQ